MLSAKKIIKEPIIFRIYLLLVTFFISVFLIWTVDIIFSYENDRIRTELVNLQQKLQLGNLLQKKLYKLHNQFVTFPRISHPKQLDNSRTEINHLINSSFQVVNTLEKGGTIYETLQSNFYETDEFINEITFVPNNSSEFIIEVINIKPKLNELQKLSQEIAPLVLEKISTTDPAEKDKLEAQISFEIKKVETILSRSHEHGNRIYYDVSNKLQFLETVYSKKLRQWQITEAIIIILISLIELSIIIYLLSRTKKVIQQQHQANDENRQLLNAVENSPVAITITDVDGKIEYVNKYFSDLTGFSKTEAIGQDTNIIKNKNQEPKIYEAMWQDVKMGKTWKGEFLNRKKDGTEYFSRSVISPIFDPNQKTTNFISIQEDLTEKKKLTSSLNKSYETLKEIFDKIPVGVVLLKGKTIVQINIAAAEIMGYETLEEATEHLNGKNCHGRYCSIKEGQCPIFDLKGKYFSLQEKDMLGKGGRKISILKSVIPVIIHDEEYLLEAFMDIEAQKKAQEREKDANRAKSEFLANMSHEIRTPMNGIIGAVDIMNKASLEEDQKMMLQIIQQSSEMLLNIINDILDFSKIEAGKLKIDNSSFNLNEAVEAIVDQFALRAKNKNLQLFHFIDKKLPAFIIGDEVRIMQILINLVGNAIKFTHEGHVLLRVSMLESKNAHKVKVGFSIEDTGIGIPDDRIEKIFEAFTQADGSTIRKYGGTGLGTTISKMLVDLMGGKIFAESPNPHVKNSDDKQGSVFHVVLDFEFEDRDSVDANAFKFSDINAVVLTNNDPTRYIKAEILKNMDVPATFFSHCDDALLYFKSPIENLKKNRLFILDFDDSEGTAFEFLSAIQQFETIKSFKVILVTSHSILPKKKEFVSRTTDAVILKPVKQSKLQQTIADLFSSSPRPVNKLMHTEPPKVVMPKLNILLAEDNLINQKIAKQSFLKLSFDIDIVNNGKKAVEAVKQNTYDFIFMDVMMPEMNGLDATREIRKTNQEVKIIAMTANAMKGDRENCLSAGMNDYISKPFKNKDLEDVLLKWV